MDLKYINSKKNLKKNDNLKKQNIELKITAKNKSKNNVNLILRIKLNFKTTKINKTPCNNIIKYITSLPVGQVITCKNKKNVYIDSDFVYKGPYSKNEKAYKNNIRYTKAIDFLENSLNLHDNYKSSLEIIDEILDHNGLIYLKFKNVGKKCNYNDKFIIRTTKIQTNVKVLPRKSFVNRISDLDNIDEKVKIAVLQHLYFRYLLDIGDSGDHNILLREDTSKRLIAGIDLEDNRKNDKGNNKLSYLFKKLPSKKQVLIYSNYIDKIKIFSKNSFNKNFVSQLRDLELDVTKIINKVDKFK